MKLFLHHSHHRPTDELDRAIEEGISALRRMLDIEAAHVRLEYRAEASPAYRAVVHLVVPGPDLRVEAIDHTARTAFTKALGELRFRAIDRAARRRRYPRVLRHLPGFTPAALSRR